MSHQRNGKVIKSLKVVFLVTLTAILCGCANIPWVVYRSYEGSEKSLEDVGVLFIDRLPDQDSQANLENVDGIRSEVIDVMEVHLLPGMHDITCSYWYGWYHINFLKDYAYTYTLEGKPRTVRHNFEKGQVYKVETSLDIEEKSWSFSIIHWGSVEQVASKVRSTERFLGIPTRAVPLHWRELRKRKKTSKISTKKAIGKRVSDQEKSSRPDRNVSNYKTEVQVNPNDSVEYVKRGNVYYNLQQYEKAISEYSKAIELDTGFAIAYYNRGNAYALLQRYEQAKKDLLKALELNPAIKPNVKQISDTYKLDLKLD